MHASAEPPTTSAPVSRRQERRQATIAEIKALARHQLAQHGAGALSLRAIARDMRMASSAIYRYFPSYDDLLSALITDAYHALGDALSAARDTRPPADHAGRWAAISHAYRHWALDNPSDFALLFGTPQPGYQAPEPVTSPAAARPLTVALEVYAQAVHAHVADPDRTQVPRTLKAGPLLEGLLRASTPDYPPRLAAITLSAWVSLLGFLAAEVFGSLSRLADTNELYAAHARTVMLDMGFDPALVHAAAHNDPEPC